MANPALSRNPAFNQQGYATFGQAPSAPQYGQAPSAPQYGQAPSAPQYGQAPSAPQYGQGAATPSQPDLEGMYGAPAAGPLNTGRMTYDDVIMKTGITLGTVVLTGVMTWFLFMSSPGIGSLLMMVGVFGGLVLGIVNSFKKNPSPALILAYAAFEGMFVGGFSAYAQTAFPGVVTQALLGTAAVFAAVFWGFKSGKFRTSPRMNKIFMAAMIGYALFSLVNLGYMFLASEPGQFGLRGGWVGIGIGALAIAMASYALVMDFEMVETGVKQGAPAKFAWAAAFGLVVTIVWLYIEILRLLMIIRSMVSD